jgi:anti-sigma regulatory factor (Ser/Thr protein kinase)
VSPNEAVADRSEPWPTTVWPLMMHRKLAAVPAAVSAARKYARAVAREFGLSVLADDIELVVSELVTNAVRATKPPHDRGLKTPVVQLWLASDLRCMLICVWDESPEMPVLLGAGPDDESGRGLMLVGSLCSEWGAYPKSDGKMVWVVMT